MYVVSSRLCIADTSCVGLRCTSIQARHEVKHRKKPPNHPSLSFQMPTSIRHFSLWSSCLTRMIEQVREFEIFSAIG